ncbi:nardilysin-like [Panonychus citri]|uniref:nardilysin-like n=1 Tax=Panonychus citri TaxID=50023 RepID=UPI0023082CEC|nr:nardilysin-like [Panonychus citri]
MFAKYLVKEGAILKSINDKKRYKLVTLINGLRALLISDPCGHPTDCPPSPTPSATSSETSHHDDDESDASDETASIGEQKEGKKLCGAALSVRVGTLSDPLNVQGLAHLVEHVILMGNKEYPEENSFDTFLNRKSGYVNAHTEFEDTVYEFQVPNRYLQESLQRFAAIFVSPLFRESSLYNEIRPIDNEFLNSLNDDECRTDSLFATLVLPDHDLYKFSFGNAKSLVDEPKAKGINLNEEVVKFWTQHYHASNMSLVVQGEYDLEIMEKWVCEYFSRIPPTSESFIPLESRVNSSNVFPYQESKFCKLFYIEPVSSGDFFHINFWLPPKFNDYKSKPLSHLGSLLGDEGKGSLFSILKKKGFALEMVAGNDDNGFVSNRYQALFTIQVKLTPLGMENLDQIVDYIWTFIDKIKSSGPHLNHLKEDQAIRLYSFAYANEKSGTRNCVTIAENMNHFGTEHILTGRKIMFQIDEDLIRQAFPHLTPSRANYIIFSKKLFNGSQAPIETEKWYGTKYKVNNIPDRWLNYTKPADFDVDVNFPLPNEFIPDNFEILPNVDDSIPKEYPECIKETLNWRLWYKLSNKYEVPKVCVNMIFRSPMARSYPLVAAALDVYVRALIMKAEEDVYPASLAGLRYYVTVHDNGLILSFVGFNDKISKFISCIVDHLVSLEFDEITFTNIRRDLCNEYFNAFNDSTELSNSLRISIIKPLFWTSLVRRTFLPQLTREMAISSGRQILSNSFLECLVLGNVTSTEALTMIKQVAAKVSASPTYQFNIAQDRVNKLPPGHHICRVLAFNKEEKSSEITNYYQFEPADVRSSVLNELLASSMYESLFDTLRSQEGLGYQVYNSHHQTSGVLGFSITVMSDADKFDCSFIDSRIEAFLVKFAGILMAMKEEEFDESVKGLIKVKSAPFITLNEETKFFWHEILEQEYRFDKRSKDIIALEQLTLSEFITWSYVQLLNTPYRKKLSIQVVGNGSKALGESYAIERNPFMPRRFDCDDDDGIINGTVDCKEIEQSGDNPMVSEINSNFENNHECSHLIGRQKRSAAFDDDDEDRIYILKHLGPRSISSDAKLIVDINEFKRYLSIYPKIRKLYPNSN